MRGQYGFLLPLVLFMIFLFYGYMLSSSSRVKWLEEIGVITKEDYNIAKERPYVLIKMIKPDTYVGLLEKEYKYYVGDLDLEGKIEKYELYVLKGSKTLYSSPFSYGYIKIELGDLKKYLEERKGIYVIDKLVVNISKGDCSGDLYLDIKDRNKEYKIKVDKKDFYYEIPGKYFYLYNITNILVYCSWKPSISFTQHCRINGLEVYAELYDKFKMKKYIILRDYKKFLNESVFVSISFIISEGKGNLYIYRGNKLIDKVFLGEEVLGEVYNYSEKVYVKNYTDLAFGFKVDYDSFAKLTNIILSISLQREKELSYSTGFIKFLPEAYKYFIINGKLQITLQISKVLREGDLFIRVESSDGNYYEEKIHIKESPKFYTLKIPEDKVKELFKPENYVLIKLKGNGLFYVKRIIIESYK